MDSPNVRFGEAQERAGKRPTNEILVPGVLTFTEYRKRRAVWDAVRQCIGLDAEFYEGAEVLLFPPEWLNLAENRADAIEKMQRQAKAIGIDPAEGGDQTAIAVVDELGLIELSSRQTPDTSVITGEIIALMHRYLVPADMVILDRGGGGKEHADRLRAQGYAVRTVAFGEAVVMDPKRGIRHLSERRDNREERYAYKNRRAEMYGMLSLRLDPTANEFPFALPKKYGKLRNQLAVIPKTYDDEGRLTLMPKRTDGSGPSMVKLIGHSPDESDALVLAIYGMAAKKPIMAGAIF